MHIEPGLVDGAKLTLSYATAAAAGGYAVKLASETVREQGIASFACARPWPRHWSSHSSSCFRIFGSAYPRCISSSAQRCSLSSARRRRPAGWHSDFLLKGCSSSPPDLPQYGMNVTTLLVPLFAICALADRIIPGNTAYVDLQVPPDARCSRRRISPASWRGSHSGRSMARALAHRILPLSPRSPPPMRSSSSSSRSPTWRCLRLRSCDGISLRAVSSPAPAPCGLGSRRAAANCSRPRCFMLTLSLIGIGCGDPEQLTLAAIRAINAADLVLIPRKGEDKSDLAELRRTICAQVLSGDRPAPR